MSGSRSIKICVIGESPSTHEVSRAEIFQTLGHEVELVTVVDGPTKTKLKHTVAASASVGTLARFKAMWRTLRNIRADLYHVHYASGHGAVVASLQNKKPLAISVMGGDVLFGEQGSRGWPARWLTRHALRRADLVTVKSQRLRETVVSMGVDSSRIMEVVWGVDPGQFRFDPERRKEQRRRWGVDDQTPILFSPRPLQPLYNQALMLEALKFDHSQTSHVRLVVSTYGLDGTYKALLESLAQRFGLSERVIWDAPRDSDGMVDAYCGSDVVLSLASSDGIPQAPLEAMACSRPVVLGDLPGFKPLFDDCGAARLAPLKAEAVREALCDVLGRPDVRKAMQEAGPVFVNDRADLRQEALRVESAFKKLVQPT